jgi:serine/threonine protein kinase
MPFDGAMVTPTLRLVRQLGAGGMGSVWVADHLTLQTQVVVKFMHADLASNDTLLHRFREEAAAAANVKSPHVVQVLDHGLAATGEPYIVMELLEGVDLASHLAQRGHLPLETVAEIVSQVCKALSRAHERGIVHRDIKPQNIFLCRGDGDDVFVKVLDFGIAKRSVLGSAASGTLTGSLLGTPYYMSPEQMMDAKHVDQRADLWALGVVAFECLTGRRPFEAETVGALSVAVCKGPIPVPSQIARTVPPEIDAWFATACSRDLAARFPSARAMAEALHDAIAQHRSSDAKIATGATIGLSSAPTVFPTTKPMPTAPMPGPAPAYLETRYPQPTAYGPASVTTGVPRTGDTLGSPSAGVPTTRAPWLVLVLAVLLFAAGGTIFFLSQWLGHAAGPGPSAASSPARPPPPGAIPADTTSALPPLSSPAASLTAPPPPKLVPPPPRASTSARPAHSFDRNAIE